ncbi:MAG TPA: hypothetical protein V6C97_29100 [Oculatellaceae cyanobacterium]
MRYVNVALLLTFLAFGNASVAQDKDSSGQQSTDTKSSTQDAETNTDVGATKNHGQQTGHHNFKCGGVKKPLHTEKKK